MLNKANEANKNEQKDRELYPDTISPQSKVIPLTSKNSTVNFLPSYSMNIDQPNKYNHLALYQQFLAKNSNISTPTNNNVQQNQLNFTPHYHFPSPLNQPTVNFNYFNGLNLSVFPFNANQTSLSLNPSQLAIQFNNQNNMTHQTNHRSKSLVSNDLFPPSEQEQLDDGFLNLLSNKKVSTNTETSNAILMPQLSSSKINTAVQSSLKSSLASSSSLIDRIPGMQSVNENLIDLDTKMDAFKTLSVTDLFDPLYEVKPPPTPIFVNHSVAATAPALPMQFRKQNSIQGTQQRDQNKLNEKAENSEKISGKRKSIILNKETISAKKKEKPKKSAASDQLNDTLRLIKYSDLSEFQKFNQAINRLKQKNERDHNDVSSLVTFSPVMECSIARKINIRLNVRYSGSNVVNSFNNSSSSANMSAQDQFIGSGGSKRYQVTKLLVSINATIETIVYNVLNLFDIEDLNAEKYLLKIHGLEECLPVNSTLAELKYISECLTENREPVLVLIELKNANTELTTKNDKWKINEKAYAFSMENLKEEVYFEESISNLLIKLETILKGVQSNRKSLLDALNEYSKSKNVNLGSQIDLVLSWLINLKEKVKGLMLLLNMVANDSLNLVVERLETFETQVRNTVHRRSLKERAPLITNDETYDYRIEKNNLSYSLSGSNNDVFASLNEFVTDVLLSKVSIYVNSVATSFHLPFRVTKSKNDSDDNLDTNSNSEELNERVEIIQANEKFYIFFNGLARLGTFLNGLTTTLSPTSDLFLKFSLMYGIKQLDYVVIKLEKLFQRKSESFFKKCKIQFDKMDLCLLPKEAYLLVQIYTTTLNVANPSLASSFQEVYSKTLVNNESIEIVSSSVNKISNNFIDKCLAWTSKACFDDKLAISSDEALLSFFEGDFSLPLGTTASNIFSNKSPVVQFTFPDYDYNYVYPEMPSDCECKLNDFHNLSPDLRERLLAICNKSVIANSLTDYDKELINKYYLFLNGIPNALSKIYLSFPAWDYSSIIHFYAFLRQADPLTLSESLELLLPAFPDAELRAHATRSLEIHSPETVSLYLPQLLEAIKYEYNHNSQLVCMLFTFASKNIYFAHKLYWQLKEFKSRSNDYMQLRYTMLFDALSFFFNDQMIDEIDQEEFLVRRIDEIAVKLKETKETDQLFNELDCLCKEWQIKKGMNCSCRLPYNISYCTREIDVKSCSHISSFTMPLKLVFKNIDPTANSFYSIYKIGDDLRQDMFVLQIINVMNQLWLMEDLDLNMLTFTCLQTGNRRGFIEMITNAETLKEIQKGAVVNAFRKNCINDWLHFHNPNMSNFKLAVENFTKSCAGYSVATYILGIGDRHNDNVMIKYTGHMFHIDFGKYLGDAQTFAGFKRDRTPILFTSDMFYVINQGKDPNFRFQEFIEFCCRAFQILRTNFHLLMSLIELMINSGIPGLNHNAITYVYKNLMIDINDDDASNAFKKLIHDSLSKFASINFAIHTLAQPKTVSSSNYFSFVTHTFKYLKLKIFTCFFYDINKNCQPFSSIELFKCSIVREIEYNNNEVYRTFDEFCDLYQLLIKTFPSLRLNETPPISKFKETKQYNKRFQAIELLVRDIFALSPEISQSDIIYTFFHSILRDKKKESLDDDEAKCSSGRNLHRSLSINNDNDFDFNSRGQVKVKIKYKDGRLSVNCLQCRNLKPTGNQTVSSLKPYVKCYLRPDADKITKRKVQALFNGANPIFTETMEYDIPLIELKKRVLELSVLNSKLNHKERIGSVEINLNEINWNNENVLWFDLK